MHEGVQRLSVTFPFAERSNLRLGSARQISTGQAVLVRPFERADQVESRVLGSDSLRISMLWTWARNSGRGSPIRILVRTRPGW